MREQIFSLTTTSAIACVPPDEKCFLRTGSIFRTYETCKLARELKLNVLRFEELLTTFYRSRILRSSSEYICRFHTSSTKAAIWATFSQHFILYRVRGVHSLNGRTWKTNRRHNPELFYSNNYHAMHCLAKYCILNYCSMSADLGQNE